MFSGLGSIMQRIKEEHQKNKVQEDSDFIDQQDFEEHVASKQEVPENNDFTQLQRLIDKLPLGTSMDSVHVEDVGFRLLGVGVGEHHDLLHVLLVEQVVQMGLF